MSHDIPKITPSTPERSRSKLSHLGAKLSEVMSKADQWIDSRLDPEGYKAAQAEQQHLQFMHDAGATRLTILEGVQNPDRTVPIKQTTRWLKQIDSEK